MGRPFHHFICSIKAIRFFLLAALPLCLAVGALAGEKVTESVIVASVEGEVSSLNMIDDFKVTIGPSSVGKKISSKTILSTGKTGKVSLLFSNGTLITVKPGSRFYLRKYKQVEAVVKDLVPPGKLEEEPTKSELSAHLDFGELIVKAPKLKKGSLMNLSSPLGTAGIRGTMFQLMAVRNSVSGDIMGGINLISGDIDFTDTGGNMVTLLSGQSIQLATSKLGEAMASQTGDLVDLTSTYGPALTQPGAMPPPITAIFPSLSTGESEDSSEDENLPEPDVVTSTGPVNIDFIHSIASEVFFAIEEAEMSSSEFTTQSLQTAPSVEVPTPDLKSPSAPAAVTGEDSISGTNINSYISVPPTISLRTEPQTIDEALPLKISNGGALIEVEYRSESDGVTWADLDPGVFATDFFKNDIAGDVVLFNEPDIVLPNPLTAEQDAPGVGEYVEYGLVYEITDLLNTTSKIDRIVRVFATRPTILSFDDVPRVPFTDPNEVFQNWIDSIVVEDVRGERIPYSSSSSFAVNTFYLSPQPNLSQKSTQAFKIVAVDWRGLISESATLQVEVFAQPPTVPADGDYLLVELSASPLSSIDSGIEGTDEFGNAELTIALASALDASGASVDVGSPIYSLKDEDYLLTFDVADSRGESTSVQRTFRVAVTPPSLQVDPFQSAFVSVKDNDSELEFTDVDDELSAWLGSQQGTSTIQGVTVSVTPSILSKDGDTDSLPKLDPSSLPVGDYVIRFTALDTRYIAGETNSYWESNLTTIHDAILSVVATRPTFDEINATQSGVFEVDNRAWSTFDPWFNTILATDVYDNNLTATLLESPDLTTEGNTTITYRIVDSRGIEASVSRNVEVQRTPPTISIGYNTDIVGGRGLTANEETIQYLVKTRSGKEVLFPDDGEFDLNQGVPENPNRPYFSATAYDGTDITDKVTVSGVDDVDFAILEQNTTLTLTVSDESVRNHVSGSGTVNGATDTITPVVTIVDVIPPRVEPEGNATPSSPYTIHGLEDADFPDPGFIIEDNYYTQAQVEAHNQIISNGAQVDYTYSDPTEVVSYASGTIKYLPDVLIVGDAVNMSVEGNYTINYNNLQDPSGNVSEGELTRHVKVIDERAPVVYLIGSNPQYLSMTQIFAGTSVYRESGVEATEDLNHDFKVGDWIEWNKGESPPWSVTIEQFIWSGVGENGSYADAEDNGTTPIEAIVEYWKENQDSLPAEPIRYRLTYKVSDEAGNEGSVTRIVELRDSPNTEPVITIDSDTEGSIHASDISANYIKPSATASVDYGSQGTTTLTLFEEYRLVDQDGSYTEVAPYVDSVNFHSAGGIDYYVDQSKNLHAPGSDGWRKLILRFYAEDDDGNSVEKNATIRRTDTTSPTINLTAADSLYNYDAFQAGKAFTDTGIASVDNHGGGELTITVDMNSSDKIETYPQEGQGPYTFTTDTDSFSYTNNLSNLEFVHPDTYTITYTARDDLNNSGTATRTLTVVDTIKPHMAIVPSSISLNFNEDEEDLSPYGNDTNPRDRAYIDTVNITLSDFPQDTTSPHANGFIVNNEPDFVLKLSETNASLSPLYDVSQGGSIETSSSNQSNLRWSTTDGSDGTTNRKFLWHSALNLNLGGETFQDPGVFVESWSDYNVSVWSELFPTFSTGGDLKQIDITYHSKQTSPGGTEITNKIENARRITFIDEVVPSISVSPETDGTNTFILVEAGENYDDSDGVSLFYGSKDEESPQDASTVRYSYDSTDGDLSAQIVTTGIFVHDTNVSITSEFGDSKENWSNSEDYLNQVIRIDYNVSDSMLNSATTSRYLWVRDTTAPTISNISSHDFESDGETLLSSSRESNETQIIAEILQNLEAADINGIDANLSTTVDADKWAVTFSPAFTQGIYPLDKDDAGYTLTISVTDDSGNIANTTRYLKIGDYTSPVITLIGDNPIHDFLRYRENTALTDNQRLYEDRLGDPADYNASGFPGGAHRLILNDYKFVDPGAYATDDFVDGDDGFFTNAGGYPSYKGKPTSFRTVNVNAMGGNYDNFEDCYQGPGIIHIWNENPELVDQPLTYFQDRFDSDIEPGGTFEVNATLPDVSGQGYEFDDANKNVTKVIKAVKLITQYRVKDGWDNFDDANRSVYIYQSEQFGGSAFYATPINKVTSGVAGFPGFYSDANSSVLRDLDGDGVSDYWETRLGTDLEDPSVFPDMMNSEFNSTDWSNYTIPRDG